jgi:hypothetical protein
MHTLDFTLATKAVHFCSVENTTSTGKFRTTMELLGWKFGPLRCHLSPQYLWVVEYIGNIMYTPCPQGV